MSSKFPTGIFRYKWPNNSGGVFWVHPCTPCHFIPAADPPTHCVRYANSFPLTLPIQVSGRPVEYYALSSTSSRDWVRTRLHVESNSAYFPGTSRDKSAEQVEMTLSSTFSKTCVASVVQTANGRFGWVMGGVAPEHARRRRFRENVDDD